MGATAAGLAVFVCFCAFNAASQSKAEAERDGWAVHGDFGDAVRLGLRRAGDGGIVRLGTKELTGGAEKGCRRRPDAGLSEMAFGDLCPPSHLQLKSVFSEEAEDGALTLSLACEEAAKARVSVLLSEETDPRVEARFRVAFSDGGGEASDIERRKSR